MLAHLSPRERIGYAVVAAIVVAFVAYLGASAVDRPAPIEITQEKPTPSVPGTDAPAPAEVVVHVTGAVRAPGVYHLPADARVTDALRAAGGALPKADLDAWNLAAKLVDGTQIRVGLKSSTPERVATRTVSPAPLSGNIAPMAVVVPDEYRSPTQPPPAYSPKRDATPKPGKSSGGMVNLNTATAEELDSLPGVGPATAKKILDYRQEHGGFTSIDELLVVKGIGDKKLAAMRSRLKL